MKTLPRAQDQICRFLGIGLIKIYLITSTVPVFESRKKCYYLSTLAYILHSSRRKPEFGCQRTKLSENFSSWHWRHFPTAAPPAKMWGGGRERLRNFQISRVELSSFLLFLGVRGASSKTIKTGLNCWQNF